MHIHLLVQMLLLKIMDPNKFKYQRKLNPFVIAGQKTGKKSQC